MRLLVVEDERRMAHYICRALAEESFAVDVAHDGPSALELAGTYDYDAIVLDLMLPGVDGLTVCRRLREAGKQTRSSSSRRGTWSRTASVGWMRGPTTIWSSRSRWRNWQRACAP